MYLREKDGEVKVLITPPVIEGLEGVESMSIISQGWSIVVIGFSVTYSLRVTARVGKE